MTSRQALTGVAAALLAASAVSWMGGCGGSSLDGQERAVVDTVEEPIAAPRNKPTAACFVTDDLDVLLSGDVADAVDAHDPGRSVRHRPGGRHAGRALRVHVVAAVAAEGEIHSEGLRPVLAEAATARLGWIDERVDRALRLG